MSDIPVKLVVFQLDHEPQQHLFEQSMIKFGKGRTGKAKSGVDLQLADPTLARVHGVIQVKKENDVFLMPMGTAATYIDGKKVKSRGKLVNGTTMELGTTQITIYIGDAAAHDYLADAGNVDIAEVETDISTGEFEIVSSEYAVEEIGAAPATDPGSAGGWADAFSEPAMAHAPDEEGTSPGSPAAMPAPAAPTTGSATFSVSTEGFSLYPMHAEPEGTFGPMGPVPPTFPEQFPQPNLEMILEVHDRLGKESWYVQEIIW